MEEIETFWKEIWSFCGVQGTRTNFDGGGDEIILEKYEKMDEFPGWFKDRRLNFTKNLLYPLTSIDPNSIAIHFRSENSSLSRNLTWKELRNEVSVVRRVLVEKFGVMKGDRIGAYAPNCAEVLVYMLAGASIGAIFTAGSPDFGPTVK